MDNNHPLRDWRRTEGVTQASLAERVGVVSTHISQIETRDRVPSIQLASRISQLTGLPVSAFVPLKAEGQAA